MGGGSQGKTSCFVKSLSPPKIKVSKMALKGFRSILGSCRMPKTYGKWPCKTPPNSNGYLHHFRQDTKEEDSKEILKNKQINNQLLPSSHNTNGQSSGKTAKQYHSEFGKVSYWVEIKLAQN